MSFAINEEYRCLRDEIAKRIELRYQIIILNITAFGFIMAIAFQSSRPALILILYPILNLLLTYSWIHNTLTIKLLIGNNLSHHIMIAIIGTLLSI